MTIVGYHASHEQFSPHELLMLAQEAEQAGFHAAMSSEHIAPWSVRQGESGFAWAWLGAAMQATGIPFGSLAIPGGWRYHPLVVAHAFATLAQMFPNRLPWIAVGSGEAMNECMVGEAWPDKPERNERLKAGVDIMRALWRGETLTGTFGALKVDQAKLWSLPATPPKIYGAALTPQTAKWMGSWADGLITVNQPREKLRQLMDAFHHNGNGKPLVLQVHVSWAETQDEAEANALDQWKTNVLPPDALGSLRTPEEFDEKARDITLADMEDHVIITSDPGVIAGALKTYKQLGFGEIYLHNVGRNQKDFIAMCKGSILPGF